MSDLCFLTATALRELIRSRRASVTEVLQAHLAQIERVNPKVNAIVTLVAERAMAEARAADEALARGDALGPLHGLPIAHKDLVPTRRASARRSARRSIKDHVPDHDALIVERIRAAGAITVGKTNTPEFGAGSQTFNPVFGATLNPYDLDQDLRRQQRRRRGGAGLRHGADRRRQRHGRVAAQPGELLQRRRASGRRRGACPTGRASSAGRRSPSRARWRAPSRTSRCCLSAIAGPGRALADRHRRAGRALRRPLDRDFKGVRVAWSRDLGGLPVRSARRPPSSMPSAHVFEALGCVVEDAEPDFSGRATRSSRSARLAVRACATRRCCDDAPRPAQGHDDLEHRAGTEAHRPARRRARSASARRSITACASSSRRYEFFDAAR